MRLSWKRYELVFKKPARTSRDTLQTRPVWIIELFDDSGRQGRGECAPLAGLSVDDIAGIEKLLDRIGADPDVYVHNPYILLPDFPSVCFGLEAAIADLRYVDTTDCGSPEPGGEISIPINGLIWMGDFDEMRRQVDMKLSEGWACIKLKIGGIDFNEELRLLDYIRDKAPAGLELRVDANGAFTADDVFDKLERLVPFRLHSIEQPVAAGQPELLREVCSVSPVPVALDEELIGDAVQKAEWMLTKIKPAYLVLKPSLLGGFRVCDEIIAQADKLNVGWWVTSALESNIGLQAIARWLYERGFNGYQGLGTGMLFENNLPSELVLEPGRLRW